MSDKSFTLLDASDQHLRRSSSIDMKEGICQIVLRICGFELFNTRHYHNYESWSDGYVVYGRKDGEPMNAEEAAALLASKGRFDNTIYLCIRAEDLDTACRIFHENMDQLKTK